jgi:hypothetical protein
MIHAHTRQKGFKRSRLAITEVISKRRGKKNDFLESRPSCRIELLYLWSMYNSILKGCDNIGYIELSAYERVTGEKLQKWESALMIDVDIIRRRQMNENI